MKYFIWILRIIVAAILIQTLYYKFSAHPDSVYIFDQTGLGANGRIVIGVLELISDILILVPKYTHLGAICSLGIISGAVFFHLTKLGIEVNNDGGTLFFLAVAVFIGSAALVLIHRDRFIALYKKSS